MTRCHRTIVLLAAVMLPGCAGAARTSDPAPVPAPAAEPDGGSRAAFLDALQRDTFAFFWETTPPGSGLTPDRYPGDPASSVAGVGFALTSYLVGVERGLVKRDDAAQRVLATLRFLRDAPQGRDPAGVSGHRGFFYHFLDPRTGHRHGQSEVSTIDTALLMAGVLSCQSYFDRADPAEVAIRTLADDLYLRVDWPWAYALLNRPLMSLGWTPENGFIEYDWAGYSEAMLLYILALGSPTHPIADGAWDRWTATYRWDSPYDYPHVGFGPLFGHQYSHVWIDFRGIQDGYMRSKGIDYFVNSTRATFVNHAYCIDNPGRWAGYGRAVWGLTASDGPGEAPSARAGCATPFRAYWARGSGPDCSLDDGTVAPTAAGGSVPFAPELAIATLQNYRTRFGGRLYGRYGFRDAFNLTVRADPGAAGGWFADQYVAIDQGPILLMVENHRTGFVWELMKRNPHVLAGLHKAGFTGGWLSPTQVTRADPPSRQAP